MGATSDSRCAAPEFHVLTGNDLAIDMVMYGSDYLLGLSTMAPDLFALRDQMWLEGDARFFELNDWLQYLGFFAFRPPVPAYKHTAAQFLKLRGWIDSPHTHPQSASRPDSDCDILAIWLASMPREIYRGTTRSSSSVVAFARPAITFETNVPQ